MPDASAPSTISHLAFGLQAGFVQQRLQRNARVHDVVHHAVGELAAVELRAAPFHAGIRRAFEEVDAVGAAGKRLRSSMVNTSGLSTRPLIISRCLAGSISAMPPWWRSKHRPDGVMMPSSSCSGVKLTEDLRLPSAIPRRGGRRASRTSTAAVGMRLRRRRRDSAPVLHFGDDRIGLRGARRPRHATAQGPRRRGRPRDREPATAQSRDDFARMCSTFFTHPLFELSAASHARIPLRRR